MRRFDETLNAIAPIDRSLQAKVQAHLDDLTKPQGSLGRLEILAAAFCLMTGATKPVLSKNRIYTFAADHGVTDEGVSAFPKAVTAQMVFNMLGGGAAVNVLARHAGAEVCVVDIGVETPFDDLTGLIREKVRPGSANMTQGPALSKDEAVRALEVGIRLAYRAAADGVNLLGTGEMGIGNTTPAAALFAALLPCTPEDIVGRGTGVDDAGLARKISAVQRALEVNRAVLKTPLDCLAAVGGLEIAGLAGLMIGAAASRIPVVVDGYISSAAALVACRMNPLVKDYLFFSHCSAERGHRLFLDQFEVEPILDLGMRLGEGSGAALAMIVIEAAIKIYNEMATFSSVGVSGKDAG